MYYKLIHMQHSFLDKDLRAGAKTYCRKLIVLWPTSLISLTITDPDSYIKHVKHHISSETMFEKAHWWFVVRFAIAITATIAAMAFIVERQLQLWLSWPSLSILLITSYAGFLADVTTDVSIEVHNQIWGLNIFLLCHDISPVLPLLADLVVFFSVISSHSQTNVQRRLDCDESSPSRTEIVWEDFELILLFDSLVALSVTNSFGDMASTSWNKAHIQLRYVFDMIMRIPHSVQQIILKFFMYFL